MESTLGKPDIEGERKTLGQIVAHFKALDGERINNPSDPNGGAENISLTLPDFFKEIQRLKSYIDIYNRQAPKNTTVSEKSITLAEINLFFGKYKAVLKLYSLPNKILDIGFLADNSSVDNYLRSTVGFNKNSDKYRFWRSILNGRARRWLNAEVEGREQDKELEDIIQAVENLEGEIIGRPNEAEDKPETTLKWKDFKKYIGDIKLKIKEFNGGRNFIPSDKDHKFTDILTRTIMQYKEGKIHLKLCRSDRRPNFLFLEYLYDGFDREAFQIELPKLFEN